MTSLTVVIEFDGQLDSEEIKKVLTEIRENVDGVEAVHVVIPEASGVAR